MNTDKLRELALAATDGPWVRDCTSIRMTNAEFTLVADGRCSSDAAYIAEANPKAIIELLDALKEIGELVDAWGCEEWTHGELHGEAMRSAINICSDQLQAILDKV